MVESAPGKGTVFTIYLPAVPREPELASNESPVDGIPKPIRANVLLVEDEDILRRCLHNTLSSMGCFVLQASDGAQALEMAKRQLLLIDLVVTDIVMPRMSGRELVNSLRALRPKLPVIFMSGYSDIAPTRDELRSGSVALFPEAVRRRRPAQSGRGYPGRLPHPFLRPLTQRPRRAAHGRTRRQSCRRVPAQRPRRSAVRCTYPAAKLFLHRRTLTASALIRYKGAESSCTT